MKPIQTAQILRAKQKKGKHSPFGKLTNIETSAFEADTSIQNAAMHRMQQGPEQAFQETTHSGKLTKLETNTDGADTSTQAKERKTLPIRQAYEH
ncbi:hypothetical protein [Allofranklinella schreckenbergeri]|uniref:hypothetical protein n=1 Tax=Allofranklinella schreckenbergeri TaxID=1076744 RepID=UPI000F5E1650|nr:hypothetical protein [Allofranklinella schreckenbergeri]